MAQSEKDKLVESIHHCIFGSELVDKTIKDAHDDYDGIFLTFTDGSYCKVTVERSQYDDGFTLNLRARASAYELSTAGLITREQVQEADRADKQVDAEVRKQCEEDRARSLIKKLGPEKIRKLLDNC